MIHHYFSRSTDHHHNNHNPIIQSVHHSYDDCQADLSKKETTRLTKNGRDGQLQHGLPDWLYEGEHADDNYDDHREQHRHDDHDVSQLKHGLLDWLYEGYHDDLLTGNLVFLW